VKGPAEGLSGFGKSRLAFLEVGIRALKVRLEVALIRLQRRKRLLEIAPCEARLPSGLGQLHLGESQPEPVFGQLIPVLSADGFKGRERGGCQLAAHLGQLALPVQPDDEGAVLLALQLLADLCGGRCRSS
jgi:hypothetical protein